MSVFLDNGRNTLVIKITARGYKMKIKWDEWVAKYKNIGVNFIWSSSEFPSTFQ